MGLSRWDSFESFGLVDFSIAVDDSLNINDWLSDHQLLSNIFDTCASCLKINFVLIIPIDLLISHT